MKKTASPEMSLIIIMHGDYETVRGAIESLHAQGECVGIELIMVAPGKVSISAGKPFIDDFYACRVVVADAVSLAQAKAEGVRAARAPIVAFIEDHTRFSKGWARALLKAYLQDIAAVGPAVVNANPATSVSWANMLVEYSPWLAPIERRPFAFLPGNNSSYRRDALLNYGEGLAEMLDTECLLHWDLHAKGNKLMMEPDAMTSHLNPSLLKPSLGLRFLEGRHFASDRSRRWPAWRRALYVAGSPLIPLVRFMRIKKEVDARRGKITLPRGTLALLALFLVISAAGEGAGYLLGPGNTGVKIYDMVRSRRDHMIKREQTEFFGNRD